MVEHKRRICQTSAGSVLAIPVVKLSASPLVINQGQSAILSWSSTDATSCTASGGWSGSRATSGAEVVSPALTTSYYISCTGDGGSVSDSVTVTVNQPPAIIVPTLNLTASPSSVSRGGTITLNWSSTDASSCSLLVTKPLKHALIFFCMLQIAFFRRSLYSNCPVIAGWRKLFLQNIRCYLFQ